MEETVPAGLEDLSTLVIARHRRERDLARDGLERLLHNRHLRSLDGSHPYWLASDRVLADEFFRPGFTSGVWLTGQ